MMTFKKSHKNSPRLQQMLKILPRDCVCGQYTGGIGVPVRKVLTSHGRRCFL